MCDAVDPHLPARGTDAGPRAQECRDSPAASAIRQQEPEKPARRFDVDLMLDALQSAYNSGAFICPLAGRDDKPDNHGHYCEPCSVRAWLIASKRYCKPEQTWNDCPATEGRQQAPEQGTR